LSRFRRVIAVGAGKGGVGKSTVALGTALALRRHGTVGVLDLDLYAPDIPAMLGIAHTSWTHVWTLARARSAAREAPIESHGLYVASTGFLLGEDQPMGLEGTTIDLLAQHLVEGVAWPALDYLVVDLPAGTSALQHVLARRLPVAGALVVVTPQRVAHLDTQKVVRLYRHLRIPVLGGVENMAFQRCPHCANEIELFTPADHADTIWSTGVERLARIAFGDDAAREAAFDALARVVVAKLAGD
jgi:ATP-binding protein involved in chromosome partitioning